MSVRKVNGFAAPYKSSTFRAETDALVNRNGILSIEGKVYEDNNDVIIPPFEVVQEGLVIQKTNATTIIKPLSLTAPYYITVSAPTTANTDDLVFQFAKSPSDVSSNEVILGEFDGLDWKLPSLVSSEGIITARSEDVVDKSQVGPYKGLLTSVSGSDFLNTAGFLYDKRGDKVKFDSDLTLETVASDPNSSWRRVDRVVYRRASDSEKRIGVRKLLVGGTYAPTGPKTSNNTDLSNATQVSTKSKVVISSDNAAALFYTEGYGGNYTIKFKKFSSERSTILNAGDVVTFVGSDKFDVTIDESDNMHLVYESLGKIELVILDSTGAVLYGPILVGNLSNPCSNPQISTDPLSRRLFIAFEYFEGPSNSQIYLATRTLTGALVTPPIRVTNTLTDIINPSLDVSDDLLVYLAYQDGDSVRFIILDDIGQIVEPEKTISSATGSTSFGTLSGLAANPVIKITDNKEVFVAFRQRKDATNYGIAVYHNGSAFLANLVTSSEGFIAFDMYADSFNNDLHICAAQAGRVDYILFKNNASAMTEVLQNEGAQSCALKKDKLGSLVHTWSNLSASTYTNQGSPEAPGHIGAVAVSGVLNTLSLDEDQISFPSTVATIPQVGMRLSLSGSAEGNDGDYIITSVVTRSIDATDDTYVVRVDSDFANPESPADSIGAQFAKPDGSTSEFIKSVADFDDVRALRTDEESSDIILARIAWPGPVILNYIPLSGIGVNSDLFGMYGDVDVDWGASSGNTLTMTNGLRIIDLVTSSVYDVAGGSYPMSEGDALYVTMNGSNLSITPGVSPIVSLPWATPIQVLGFVKNGEFHPHLFSVAGMGQLDVGESIVLGEDLSKSIRIRLGITSEASMGAYPSAQIVNATDAYNTAIGKLDAYCAAVGLDHALEDEFIVTDNAGATTFEAVEVDGWSSDNTFPDIVVFVNGQKQTQDKTGGLTKDYRKTSTTGIEFSYTVPKNAVVTIRKERTGSPPVASSVDLTSIGVDPQPQANASQSLGSSSKAWKKLYMKDTMSNSVYELKIVNGVLQVVEVV